MGEHLDRSRHARLLAQLEVAITALRWANRAVDRGRQGAAPLPPNVKTAITAALSSITVATGELSHLHKHLGQHLAENVDANVGDDRAT